MKIYMMVLMLAFTSEAFADEGWVLWGVEGYSDPKIYHRFQENAKFFVLDGFASVMECKAGRAGLTKSLQKYFQESGYEVHQLERDKSFIAELIRYAPKAKAPFMVDVRHFNFLCLPNGTDPRQK